jgi:hypothetical protein
MGKSKALTIVKRKNVERIAVDVDYRAFVQETLELENISQDREKAVRAAINSAFYAGIAYAVEKGITPEQLDEINR